MRPTNAKQRGSSNDAVAVLPVKFLLDSILLIFIRFKSGWQVLDEGVWLVQKVNDCPGPAFER